MPDETSEYRLSPALAVRFMGAFLALVGILVFLAALLVGVLDLPADVLSAVVILALVGVVTAGVLAGRLAVLVRLDEVGYRVRHLRKVGVPQARWADVESVVTGFVAEHPVVEIRLRDGRTTTIPVNLLAGSGEDFARDVQGRLKRR